MFHRLLGAYPPSSVSSPGGGEGGRPPLPQAWRRAGPRAWDPCLCLPASGRHHLSCCSEPTSGRRPSQCWGQRKGSWPGMGSRAPGTRHLVPGLPQSPMHVLLRMCSSWVPLPQTSLSIATGILSLLSWLTECGGQVVLTTSGCGRKCDHPISLRRKQTQRDAGCLSGHTTGTNQS